MNIDFEDFRTTETQLNGNLKYQSRILCSSSNLLFLKRAVTFPIRKFLNAESDNSDCEYLPFKIPEPLYYNSDSVAIRTESNSEDELRINPYRNDHVKIKSSPEGVYVPIEQFEVGHNIISTTSDIIIKEFEFESKPTSNVRNIEYVTEYEDDYLNVATSFLINSQILTPEISQFHSTCYTIYDYDNSCYRKPYWIWSDAPTVSALLANSNPFPEVTRSVADSICEFQYTTDQLGGAFVSRYRQFGNSDYPFETLIGPNDTSFIAKWCLLPMYSETNKSIYLDKARDALDWVYECCSELEFVPSHYYLERGEWEDSTFVDVGLLPLGFAEYQRVTGELPDRWEEAVLRFVDSYISDFKLQNGFFGQDRDSNSDVTERLFARGQGWALAGLLSAYQISDDKRYLYESEKLGDKMVENQMKDGYWGYLLGHGEATHRTQRISGACEKTTSVLAYYLMELGSISGDVRYTRAALRALEWCEDQIYLEHGSGYGGIVSSSRYSGITDLPFVSVATGYANAYYILAKKKYKHNS